MRRTSRSEGGVAQPIGRPAATLDQFVQRLHRRPLGVDDQQIRHGAGDADRHVVLQGTHLRAGVHQRIDRLHPHRVVHQGIAVGRTVQHALIADIAACPGLVLHDDLLPQFTRERLRYKAGDEVGRPPCRERHQQRDGFRGPGVRHCRRGQDRRRQGRSQCFHKRHDVSVYFSIVALHYAKQADI
ncbi:hypothetical protein D3C72_1775850 [compost metagenome]